jgi:integrase
MMPPMDGRVTGHLEDLGHDRWRMVANLPAIVEDGQRRYPRTTKVVQARGLRRAETFLAKWITDLDAHDCTDPTRITVAELVRRWLDEAKWKAWAGPRRGEVCGLRWQNVDLDGGRLAIAEVLEQTKAGALHVEPPKTAHGERVVPLAPAVVEILRRHKARQDEYAIADRGGWNATGYVVCRRDGSPMKPDNLSSAWSTFVRSHGLPTISFHDLRHTYATDLFAQAENPELMLKVVQDLLGHAHASTTADIYLHATDGAAEVAMAAHGDRVGAALRKASKNSHSSSTRVVSLAERRRQKSSK